MTLKSMTRSNVYTDIVTNTDVINAWKDKYQLSISGLSLNINLHDYDVIDYIEETSNRSEKSFETDYIYVNSVLTKLLQGHSVYLYKTEHKYSNLSKIKTHKGIISSAFDKASVIQYEKSKFNISLITALVKINDSDLNLPLDMCLDSSNSFLYCTNRSNYFSIDNLKTITEKCLLGGETPVINYFLVMNEIFKSKEDFLIRASGDGGVTNFGFQIFCNKKITDYFMFKLNP